MLNLGLHHLLGVCLNIVRAEKKSKPPRSRTVGHRPDKASEVTSTMACPNRSRAAGYSNQDHMIVSVPPH